MREESESEKERKRKRSETPGKVGETGNARGKRAIIEFREGKVGGGISLEYLRAIWHLVACSR